MRAAETGIKRQPRSDAQKTLRLFMSQYQKQIMVLMGIAFICVFSFYLREQQIL